MSTAPRSTYDPPDRLGAAFAAADWAFTSSGSKRELHPYPARFVSELPAQALDLLGVTGSVIDPFCCSGTTLAECRRRGLDSVGIDLNPIACLISRVRCQSWSEGDEVVGQRHAQALWEAALEGELGELEAMAIPRLDHWFDGWASEALAGATRFLSGIQDDLWRDRVAVAISSTIVRLSRQDSDTRYAAVHRPGDRELAAKALYEAMIRVCDWLSTNTAGYRESVATVYERDARDMDGIESDSLSAAIFSPPYPNAYEYWLYHKYRMYWLGHDPIAVRNSEIGARPHYCRPNGLTAQDFQRQMAEVFSGLARVLKHGSQAVVVVGDSVIGGEQVDNGLVTMEAALPSGFELISQVKRPIATRRSSFNRAHSRGRRDEHVLMFRLDKLAILSEGI